MPVLVCLALVLLAACRHDGRPPTHWEVHREFTIEAFGRDTTTFVTMSERADSGPRGMDALMIWNCELPADPSTRFMVTLSRSVDRGETSTITVRSRIDAGPIVDETWVATPSGTAGPMQFDQNARHALTNALWHAREFRLEFPLNGGREAFRFRAEEFPAAYTKLKRFCQPP